MFREKYKYWYRWIWKNKSKFILNCSYNLKYQYHFLHPVQFLYGIFSLLRIKRIIWWKQLHDYENYDYYVYSEDTILWRKFVKREERRNNLQTIMQRVLSRCMCRMCRTYKYIRPSYVVRSISWRYSSASKSASNTVPRISILFHKVEFTPSYFLH